jgi:hypothetical protein
MADPVNPLPDDIDISGQKDCVGTARVLKGNARTIGRQGACPGIRVAADSAAVMPPLGRLVTWSDWPWLLSETRGMSLNPAEPIFAIERETGDLTLQEDMSDVILLASEFWDILDEDFIFFDAAGRRLVFPQDFLDRKLASVRDASSEERAILGTALEKYGRKNNIMWTSDQSFDAFIQRYRSR